MVSELTSVDWRKRRLDVGEPPVCCRPSDEEAILKRPELFPGGLQQGLEGFVSKRGDRLYRGGKSPYWLKVKKPCAPRIRSGEG
jgi:hypothetical protein